MEIIEFTLQILLNATAVFIGINIGRLYGGFPGFFDKVIQHFKKKMESDDQLSQLAMVSNQDEFKKYENFLRNRPVEYLHDIRICVINGMSIKQGIQLQKAAFQLSMNSALSTEEIINEIIDTINDLGRFNKK